MDSVAVAKKICDGTRYCSEGNKIIQKGKNNLYVMVESRWNSTVSLDFFKDEIWHECDTNSSDENGISFMKNEVDFFFRHEGLENWCPGL
jgi:hypothetical protein